jgi:ketosteroid isomerase-like protein
MSSGPAGVIEEFAERMNARDLDGALALYEPGAAFQAQPGEQPVQGAEAIREALAGFLALEPAMSGEIVKVVEAGDVALVMNRWALRGRQPDGAPIELAGTSADVVRRQDDGSWRVVVDDPWGGDA